MGVDVVPGGQYGAFTNPSARFDAFGRARVSNPQNLISGKQIYDSNPDLFRTRTVGAGNISYNSTRASSSLTVSAASDLAVRQSKNYVNYQPGKSQQVLVTFVATNGIEAGVIKRVGYFDQENGIFLEVNGPDNEIYFVIRSSVSGAPVDTKVAQGAWNLNNLEGVDVTGIILDITQSQIFFCDLEWLGVGTVRCGFVINGMPIVCHAFNNANINSSVYMNSPNLPIRWEIESVSGAGSLESICGSVASEGGSEIVGLSRSADRGNTGKGINNSGLQPLISIRLDPTNSAAVRGAVVVPTNFTVASSSNANLLYAVYLNPTFTTGVTSVWNASSTNSPVEFDIAQDGVINGGTKIFSGYFANNADFASASIREINALGVQVDTTTSDIITIAAQNLGGGTENVFSSLSWVELS